MPAFKSLEEAYYKRILKDYPNKNIKPGLEDLQYIKGWYDPHMQPGWSEAERKYIKPAWASPSDTTRVIPGGSPSNPMGVAALTLSGGQYAIHGTNRPDSIGGFVSLGCIRMYNQDVMDLFQRVSVGTPVVVTR